MDSRYQLIDGYYLIDATDNPENNPKKTFVLASSPSIREGVISYNSRLGKYVFHAGADAVLYAELLNELHWICWMLDQDYRKRTNVIYAYLNR